MPWLRNAKLSAEPLASASKRTLPFTPMPSPIALASQSATTFWNSSMLLRILSTCPQPTGPHSAISVANAAIKGFTSANTCGSAPPPPRLRPGAPHHGKRARLGGGARSRDRRIDEGCPVHGELLRQPARSMHRRGAQVDHDLSRANRSEQSVGGVRELVDRFARGQRKEHDVRAFHDAAYRAAVANPLRGQALERPRIEVEGDDVELRLDRQVAADRLAHHAQPDESDAPRPGCHFFLP